MEEEKITKDFIRTFIDEDLKAGKYQKVVTRFPPEPNGYLHIGHAKAICIDYGIAEEYKGRYHLRLDDTNPTKDEQRYINAIKDEIRWLGFDWGKNEFYASDYFDQLYEWAILLIKNGKAYVDDQSAEQIRENRGTLKEPGKNSPWRDRSVEENLELFKKMKNGDFPDGSRVLRAKIDMMSPNINLRDPVMYRILHASHPRTGDKWCIYPMYDWAHGQSDWIEGITHSLCSLEFEDKRPLYEWFLNELKETGAKVEGHDYQPRQIEFARLYLTHTIVQTRVLRDLIEKGILSDWDDPRLPTLSAMRRRGFTPESIRDFCDRIGIAKSNSMVDVAFLEHCLREDLNKRAPRVMAVLRPLKVVITNYPDDKVEWMEAVNNPEDESAGKRKIPFSKVIYIEQDDFMEDPPRKFFRLSPGREIRLKHAYYVTCTDVIKDEKTGKILELHCTYDPETRGGWSEDGRKVKGTSHWVSADHAVDGEIRLYDRLFLDADVHAPGKEPVVNPNSLEVLTECKLEPGLAKMKPGDFFQFLRQGYFVMDPDSTFDKPVFNRSVSLRDSWAKIQKKGK